MSSISNSHIVADLIAESRQFHIGIFIFSFKGNIYIFDPTKTDANGFEKGAALEALGGALYLGVF